MTARMNGRGDRLYCSGPISGIAPAARDAAFARSVEWATSHNWRPVNPMSLPPHDHNGPCPRGRMGNSVGGAKAHTEACHLRTDYLALAQCSGILLAPGWRASWGCKSELAIAADIGLRILFWVGTGARLSVAEAA